MNIRDNLQHIAGIVVGKCIAKTSFRFAKSQRGTLCFSTVSANLAADGIKQGFWIYR